MVKASDAQTNRSGSLRFDDVPCDGMATTENGHKERPRVKPPKMGRHSSGQARVTLGGKVHYLGAWGSAEAHENYAKLVRQWEAGGNRPLVRVATAPQAGLRVRDLLDQWLAYLDATGRYRKNGEPTSQRNYVECVCKSLAGFAGAMLVTRMTEAVVVAWREILERNHKTTRVGINRKVGTALQAFRWGKARGFVSRTVWSDVSAIERLKRGQVGDRPEHGRPRRAVSIVEVEKVAAFASPQVAAMMRVQSLTGMRPGEACALRWCDIDKVAMEGDTSGAWLYRVPSGKTSHHGHSTRYVLPKAAQKVLEQFPATPLAYIFSPSAAMAERRARLRANRKTPPTKQMMERDAAADRDYRDRWGVSEYRQAVERACAAAGVARFTPHEIRHGFVTWAANTLGLLAAAAAANHTNVGTTQRYVHVRPADALAVAAAVQARAGG